MTVSNSEIITDYDIIKLENRMLNRKVKLLEKDLKKWKDTVRKPIEGNEELRIFIAGIAHSLRNEILLIHSTARQLKYNKSFEIEKDAETIEQSARLSELLLTNLSDYLGYGEVLLKPISVCRAFEELKTLLIPRLPKNIELITNIRIDPDVKVLANEEQLIQMFLNIVNNAIAAMRDKEKGKLRVFFAQSGQTLEILISDNGCGISTENLQKIFDISFSTKRKGWGMGLYLTRIIISKYNGTIDVESEEGKGTTININLPVYPE